MFHCKYFLKIIMAVRTGLEPATSCVTGRRSNQAELPLHSKGCPAVTCSRMANATLPSAHGRFTSVFGTVTGGATPLWPPGVNLMLSMRKAD